MRHFIFGFDGTGNTAKDQTNVYRLMNILCPKDANIQVLKFYYEGVGTRTQNDNGGLISGHGTNSIYNEAMNDLRINKYSQDDKIYIFGFSRGAIIAKLFALNITYYNDYISPFLTNAEKVSMPRVEFLGTFDAVWGKEADYRSFKETNIVDFPKNVTKGLEILALDEHRDRFLPVQTEKGENHSNCEKIWLSGEHSDVGGHITCCSILSSISLACMIDRLIYFTDLSVNLSDITAIIHSTNNKKISISLQTGFKWWFMRKWGIRLSHISDGFYHDSFKILQGKNILQGRKLIRNYFNNSQEIAATNYLIKFTFQSELMRSDLTFNGETLPQRFRRITEESIHA